MTTVNVKNLMAQYAAKRGISAAEVKDLEQKLGFKPGAAELAELQSAAATYRDTFTAAGGLEYDRFVGMFGVDAGQVVREYQPFNDTWKIDSSASFRAKWGLTSKYDEKAPAFERQVATSSAPAALKSKFVSFASSVLHRDVSNMELAVRRVYDRKHQPVGWAISVPRMENFTSYYRNDGTPAGLSRNPPLD